MLKMLAVSERPSLHLCTLFLEGSYYRVENKPWVYCVYIKYYHFGEPCVECGSPNHILSLGCIGPIRMICASFFRRSFHLSKIGKEIVVLQKKHTNHLPERFDR